MHTHHMTRISWNRKVGPIPVTTSSKSTCPVACPLRGNGCYAEYGPLGMHWNKVSEGRRGGDLDDLCAQIKALPKHQLWRYGQAGDLPGDGTVIDSGAVLQLIAANKGRRGFGYTHYDPAITENAHTIELANASGFTVNLSANDLEHADDLADLEIGPVVTVLPADTTNTMRSPKGRLVTICPASGTSGTNITCATCAICANSTRKAIIGFPAHGTGAGKAQAVFFAKAI